MRALLLFIIGLTFGFGAGFLTGGGLGDTGSHDHAGHDGPEHDHSDLIAWIGPTAYLSLALTPDTGNAMNLNIKTVGFIFTPQAVNTEPTAGTGHAHVYVNGEKVGRAYSNWYHIENVDSGDVIRVTLNANNHALWEANGQPFAAEVIAP